MPPAFTSPRRLPPWKSRTSALGGTRSGALLPLADGGSGCTFSSRFETATRPFFAPLSRASHGRMRFNDLCRSMFQRARRWAARDPRRRSSRGWPPLSIDRCLSIDGDRRRSSGSGVEDHRASTFPPGIAPGRDFAPTPIASDTSCRGHCLAPCLESTRVTGEAAGAASASKARAAGGRCADRFPRRNQASSRPRCLPSQGRPRTGATLARGEPADRSLPRLFHCEGDRARDARPGPLQLGLSIRENG